MKTAPAGNRCFQQRSTFWLRLQKERAKDDIHTWTQHTELIKVERHFDTPISGLYIYEFSDWSLVVVHLPRALQPAVGHGVMGKECQVALVREKTIATFNLESEYVFTFELSMFYRTKPSDPCKACWQTLLLL